MNKDNAFQELNTLAEQLQLVKANQLRISDLVSRARASQALLAALPEKYSVVMNDLLDRLESGALFTEESCSFSQRDLFDSLATWINKASSALTSVQASNSIVKP
jgi:hypothetical protein